MLFERCLGKLVSDGIVEMALNFIAGLLDPESGDNMQTQDEILELLVCHRLDAGPDRSLLSKTQCCCHNKPVADLFWDQIILVT